MRKSVISLCCVVFFTMSPAFASESSGYIVLLTARGDINAIEFAVSGEIKNPIRCNSEKHYVIKLGKPGGRALFDMIKLAREEKKPVEVKGLGTCIAMIGREDVKFITIKGAP